MAAAARGPADAVSVRACLRRAGRDAAGVRPHEGIPRAVALFGTPGAGMRSADAFIRTLPKVLLHDHLDGGLRPQTIVELAADQRYKALPTRDAGELARWFHRGAQRGSLPLYLKGFEHTCGVMQTEEALERVAYEMIEDMH